MSSEDFRKLDPTELRNMEALQIIDSLDYNSADWNPSDNTTKTKKQWIDYIKQNASKTETLPGNKSKYTLQNTEWTEIKDADGLEGWQGESKNFIVTINYWGYFTIKPKPGVSLNDFMDDYKKLNTLFKQAGDIFPESRSKIYFMSLGLMNSKSVFTEYPEFIPGAYSPGPSPATYAASQAQASTPAATEKTQEAKSKESQRSILGAFLGVFATIVCTVVAPFTNGYSTYNAGQGFWNGFFTGLKEGLSCIMVGWKEGVSGVGNRVYETFDASPTREYGGLIPSVNRARQQDRIAREKDKKSSKKEESTVVQHLADAQTKLSTLAQKKNDAGKVTIGSVSQQTSTPVTFTDQEREKVEKSGQGNVREPETKKDAKPAAKSAPASASANAQTSSDAVVGVQSPNKDDKDKPAHPHH